MFRNIFAALGAAMLVFGTIGGASAASVDIFDGFGTPSLNNTDTYTAQDGTGLASSAAFDHTYSFTVVAGGLSVDSIIQSIFEPVGNTNEGVKNLTIQWTDLGGVQTLFHVTGDDAARCAAQAGCAGDNVAGWPAAYTTFLAAGAASVNITGTTLSNGGSYTLFISAVPLPAAALLFGSALLGGGLLRRRKMIKEFGLPA